MIKSEELRIGNYIYDKYNRQQEVLSIETEFCIEDIAIRYKKYYNIVEEIKNVKPIPLTEDWLKKLPEKEWEFTGFGTIIIYQHKKFKAIALELTSDNTVAVYFNDELINFKKHVHSLQNIFYSLTNKELKIV